MVNKLELCIYKYFFEALDCYLEHNPLSPLKHSDVLTSGDAEHPTISLHHFYEKDFFAYFDLTQIEKDFLKYSPHYTESKTYRRFSKCDADLRSKRENRMFSYLEGLAEKTYTIPYKKDEGNYKFTVTVTMYSTLASAFVSEFEIVRKGRTLRGSITFYKSHIEFKCQSHYYYYSYGESLNRLKRYALASMEQIIESHIG